MLRRAEGGGTQGGWGQGVLMGVLAVPGQAGASGRARFLPALFAAVGEVPASLKARSLASVIDPRREEQGGGRRAGRKQAERRASPAKSSPQGSWNGSRAPGLWADDRPGDVQVKK